ncbi:magnesium chelatase subunit D [Sphingomonas sp. TREG-RG-20F-R18-01]|uniref:magnesium chelatase subunit D n=1 Tax=Sphingomonas sp. TREG-RG-20F-R18-01 TaxID=2914982 RepID=UPI001F5AEA03
MIGIPTPPEDALLAARLCAWDPVGLGGMVLHGGGGEVRDAVVATLHAALAEGAPLRRLPVHGDDAALLGGLDLTATLALGRPVRQHGVLVGASGGLVVVPMAERMAEATAARIASVLDARAVDGMPVRLAVVALDDGVDEEATPRALAERLAFWTDLSANDATPAVSAAGEGEGKAQGAEEPADPLTILVEIAMALGVDSARATLFALRAARASAALAGRAAIHDSDLVLAVRLVLLPRATRLPASPAPETTGDAPPPDAGDEDKGRADPPEDVVLAAALATLPRDVLDGLATHGGRRSPSRTRGAGERRMSAQRGRPLGSRAGVPRGGLRLSLIDTIRAAAPWQALRARGDGPIRIRRADLRIRRFETRAETLTIFAVDASGSAAAARLAEAKGAVELLLAQAYVKRAQVALVAFRGTGATVLLPPTRSLTRARRALADLPGGGGTPLAAGLDAARDLAEAARARGRTPFLVVLTDGRGNIAVDGTAVRERAARDAEQAARAIGQAGIAAVLVDTAPRPRPEGARLALAMGARYLPLPRADAAAMHRAVAAAQAA